MRKRLVETGGPNPYVLNSDCLFLVLFYQIRSHSHRLLVRVLAENCLDNRQTE